MESVGASPRAALGAAAESWSMRTPDLRVDYGNARRPPWLPGAFELTSRYRVLNWAMARVLGSLAKSAGAMKPRPSHRISIPTASKHFSAYSEQMNSFFGPRDLGILRWNEPTQIRAAILRISIAANGWPKRS